MVVEVCIIIVYARICVQADLSAVSPMEDFNCSLGVDPAIKVTYKPITKYREQSGLITKSVSTVYKQVTELKNTRLEAVKVLMRDQLPLSTEEKIKVRVGARQCKC